MVTVFVPRESDANETRVAATPETVHKLLGVGLDVLVEEGAGADAFISDAAFEEAGAELVVDATDGYSRADLILKVLPLTVDEVALTQGGATVVSFLVPSDHPAEVAAMEAHGLTVFSMHLVPRITRAQRMDALSSQANIAGYKAALIAAEALPRFFPLLMTAAGTIKPAVVVVMGAGVAGLQAIATARRLGAQVWASDVRLAAKEQVESVGGRFIEVPGMEDMEDARGYAKQATAEFLERQRQVVGEKVMAADVVITTALVAGRKAPVLVPQTLVKSMKNGSVIVDIAAPKGGNCELSRPGEAVVHHGVMVIGTRDLACSVPFHASELYARNVLAFVTPLIKGGALHLDLEDEVVAKSLVTGGPERPPDPAPEPAAESGKETPS